MKKIHSIIVVILFIGLSTNAQTISWKNIKQYKHIASVNVAAEFALNYGVAYSFRLPSKRPILLSSEYSFPSGNNFADDYKIKTGTQIHWLKSGNFHFASKFQGIFRRYHNNYARLLNFGADISATGGYYKQKWFVAGELGIDKAIITHFKHSDLYKENFPGVKDGWYEPSTGGNIYIGVQAGWSFQNKDLYLKLGKLSQQDLYASPMLPIYAQLGFNIKFGKR